MEHMARASIEEGADSLFFATQVASRHVLTRNESRAFGQSYDPGLLKKLGGQVDFVLLHIHGEDIFYQDLFQYPVQIVNWHDRKTPPMLKEGKELFHGAVAGGIDEWNVLATSTPEVVHAQVRDAIQQTEGIGLVVTAGCVISTDTPEVNIRAARAAVEAQVRG
jgi:uroporphyrinogen decarboxylase